jgi:ribonuclease BN (tRNA processing enzyme)
VNVNLVPSAVAVTGEDQVQFLSSYLINRTVAIDAGCLGFYMTPQEQAAVKHLLITHTHIDHIASLPIFLENAYEGKRDAVTVYGSEPVLTCLQQDLFNDRVWPDFIRLSVREAPFLKLHTLEPGRPVELEGLRITPVSVNHVVPTTGFVVEEEGASVIVVSDTGPTEAIWEYANAVPDLKAVFLEATFPNEMSRLADVSRHLTPTLFAVESRKLTREALLIAVHIKARFRAQVVEELRALRLPNLEIGQMGRPYSF